MTTRFATTVLVAPAYRTQEVSEVGMEAMERANQVARRLNNALQERILRRMVQIEERLHTRLGAAQPRE